MAKLLPPTAKERGQGFERKPVPVPTHRSPVGPFLAACARAQLRARPRPPGHPPVDRWSLALDGDKLWCLDGGVSWPRKPEVCSPVAKQLWEGLTLIMFKTGNEL